MKILVVEDEVVISAMMSDMLTKCGYEVVGAARNHEEGIEFIKTKQPDFVMLDINLGKGKDGVELAQIINEEYKIPFVFVTSNADSHTVNRAKKTKPFGYLQKPFNQDDLYSAVEVALINFSRKGQHELPVKQEGRGHIIRDSLFVKVDKNYVKFNFSEILYVKSEDNYISIVTADKKYLVRSTLKEFLQKLPENQFVQTQRSYVVNVNQITGIASKDVLIGDYEVPLSKQVKEELLEKLT